MDQTQYGLPYAMAAYDIERIEETQFVHSTPHTIGVNDRLKEGWVLLAIIQSAYEDMADPTYILGCPRPQYCKGHFDSDHGHSATERKQWDHNRKKWVCRACLEHEAYLDNEHIDNPNSPF